MGIKEGMTTFELSRPLKYSRGGNSQVETTTIELYEPGMEQARYYLKLKQMLTRCQMEFAKQSNELRAIGSEQKPIHEQTKEIEDDTDDLVEMFSTVLLASEAVDVSKFLDTFREMATAKSNKSICRLDAGQAMTEALFDRLSPDDAFMMAVTWAVFFGTQSGGKEKITSGQQQESLTEPMVV